MYSHYQDKLDAEYRERKMQEAEKGRMTQASKSTNNSEGFFSKVFSAFKKSAEKTRDFDSTNDMTPTVNLNKPAHSAN